MEKEYDLDKLGTVLAVNNQITKDALDKLSKQQTRQADIIRLSLAIIAMAFFVVCWTVYCSTASINILASQVEANRIRSEINTEAINYERAAQTSTGLPK